ncbi:MAG: FG-GAP-like repeat-containing protein [Bacteroidia bacterium]
MRIRFNIVKALICYMACALLYFYANSLNAQISISSMNPGSGPIGTSVTIRGSNFNTTTSNNIVYFGATKGTVTACTDTSINVTVNSGASYENVSVSNISDKQVATAKPFASTFTCGGAINSSSFGPPTNYTAGNSPRSISVADLDGDGHPDIVITNSADSTISILKNLSEIGGFSLDSPVQLVGKMSPQDIAIGDITGDGKPDIAVVSKDSNMVTTFRNTSSGNTISFGQKVNISTGLSPKGISLADIDRDGRLEIIVSNEGANTVSVFKNTLTALGGISYNSKIDFPTGSSPRSVAAEDIDGDGMPDVITTNYGGNNFSVLKNTSSGGNISFDSPIDFTTGVGPQSIRVADLDSDGMNDVVITNNTSGTISVYKNTSNTGSVSFSPGIDALTGTGPVNVAVGDVDGDGAPDLSATNKASNTVSVFKNTSTIGTISLNPKLDFTVLSGPIGVVLADFNGDGRPDLGAANDTSFCLLINTVHVSPLLVGVTSQSICSGTAVNYSLVTDIPSTYSWSANSNASVTGESLTNQTTALINDTLYNTTSTSQTVTYPIVLTSTGENCVSSPQTLQITVLPLPNANAGADSTLTCTNSSIALTGSSTTSPVSYQWTAPDNTVSNTQSVTANSSGNYILTVTNTSTMCINTDTVLVSYDTITPVVTSPLAYQILNCVPGTITINGTSDNASDSIKWFGPGIPTTNPATISNPNNYQLWVKRNSNGCVTTQTITVSNQSVLPVIYIPVGTDTVPVIPIVDTLTCSHDSVQFNFQSNSASAEIKIVRPAPMNDTVANSSFTILPGIYKAIIKDTSNGCDGNSLLFEIKQYTTLPQLTMPAIVPPFNCSYTTAVLNGSSGTPNSQMQWTGPGNYASANPATVSQAGDYIFSVTHPDNGCIKSDTLTLAYQNVLFLNTTGDTTLCMGDTVQLSSSAVGGTPSFTYNWNNNGSSDSVATVTPNGSTAFIITVTDANGCSGTDTIQVNIAPEITDSTLTFHLCDPLVPNGQIQIYASNGVLPYSYSIDNGLNFQASQVFPNLPYGTYPIVIKDAMGCTHSDSATVNTQSHKPFQDFIVNTSMMQADSFVVVDISNPRPDSIIWTFPTSVTMINTNAFAPVIVSSDTGSVSISMEAHFGSCIMYLTKLVQFIKADTLTPSPNGNGIDSITVFPNPNTGQFSVEVTLLKKQTLALYVYNSNGIEQARVVVPDTVHTLNTITLPNPVPGTYLLKVVAEYDAKSKTIVVTQ